MNTPTKRPRRPAGRRDQPVPSTISGAFEDGKSEVECLREEITDWKDNLESNNKEHLPKYEEVSECAEALEQADDALQSLEVPECLEEVDVTYTRDTRTAAQSRSGRMGNADLALCAAKDAAEAWLEENPELELQDDADEIEDGAEEVTQEQVDERQEQREAVEQFISELEDAISYAQDASFPGMY